MYRIIAIAYILCANAATAWLAALPLLTWGINPWTLLGAGSLALPAALTVRMFVFGPIGRNLLRLLGYRGTRR
jgi:hypothetical protein